MKRIPLRPMDFETSKSIGQFNISANLYLYFTTRIKQFKTSSDYCRYLILNDMKNPCTPMPKLSTIDTGIGYKVGTFRINAEMERHFRERAKDFGNGSNYFRFLLVKDKEMS